MAITIRCTCGQEQFVADEAAGTTQPCVMCGLPITVPRVVVIAKVKRSANEHAGSANVGPIVAVSIGMLLVVATSVIGVVWWTNRTEAERGTPVAKNREDDARTERPSTPQKSALERPPTITPPIRRNEPEIDPIRIPVKKPVTPEAKRVIEPVASGEPTKKVDPAEPVSKPTDPVKPKETQAEPKKPVNVMEPLKLVWKLRQGEVFFQELVVTQKPTFKVQGLPIAMMLQYRIVSRFTVTKENADGSLVVEQKVESAKLLQADDLSKPSIAGAITRLPGTVHAIELSPKLDVTKFDAPAAKVQANPLELAGGLGFATATLIDRDGWKELVQSTFFQFDQPIKPGLRWAKPMTHNWGGLGSWQGQVHYLYVGKDKDLHRVAYGLQLAYKMPMAGGVGMMQVNSANFQPQQAEGVILFDAARGRVIAAEERFRVKGAVNANVLGQNSLIEIDEDQHFAIRIHDKIPP